MEDIASQTNASKHLGERREKTLSKGGLGPDSGGPFNVQIKSMACIFFQETLERF